MDTDEGATFRRRRDEEWCAKIDHRLTTTMLGYQDLNKEVSRLSNLLEALDDVLRGDPGEETDGIVEQLHQIQKDLAMLKAVVFRDATGKGGLIEDVRAIREGREDKRGSWSNWTKIAVAAIMSGLLTHFWSNIAEFVTKKSTDPLEREIEQAEHPRPIHRHYTIIQKAQNEE